MKVPGLLKAALVATTALSLGGCGTISNFVPKDPPNQSKSYRIYGGVRREVEILGEGNGHPENYMEVLKFFIVLDFPLSLALDTATLPIMLVAQIFKSDEPPGPRRARELPSPTTPPEDPK